MYSPRIPEQFIPVLYHLARRRGTPMTALVAEAVAEYLHRHAAAPAPPAAPPGEEESSVAVDDAAENRTVDRTDDPTLAVVSGAEGTGAAGEDDDPQGSPAWPARRRPAVRRGRRARRLRRDSP